MNRVCLTGRLTATPALSTTKNGKSVSTFQVAVRQDREHTDFFRVVAWQTTAEHVCRWFSKGQMIAIEGRLSTNRYTDKDGKTREQVEIVAEEVGFCDSVRAGEMPPQSAPTELPAPPAPSTTRCASGPPSPQAGKAGEPCEVAPAVHQTAREIEEIVDGDLPF